MSDQYKQLGKGTLNENQYKKSEKQPDKVGKLTLLEDLPAGEYAISAWENNGQYGPYISVSVQPKKVDKEAAPF